MQKLAWPSFDSVTEICNVARADSELASPYVEGHSGTVVLQYHFYSQSEPERLRKGTESLMLDRGDAEVGKNLTASVSRRKERIGVRYGLPIDHLSRTPPVNRETSIAEEIIQNGQHQIWQGAFASGKMKGAV